MGWNDMMALQTGLIREQQMLKEQERTAAEAAQANYLMEMIQEQGFKRPEDVKQGLYDKLTPWDTPSEIAMPYAEQLLANSALALDKEWYDKNVAPNRKTEILKEWEWLGSEAANKAIPSANWPQQYNTEERNFQSRNPYRDLSREDLIAKGQQNYSGFGNPEMAQPAARGTQPISGVLEKKTNTEKFLEYLKQSAGAKL